MKTLEEKARAYDEAVNKLRRFMARGVEPLITRADVQDFFPELKESKDEMIREKLIEFFKDWGKRLSHCWGLSIPDILAWLENQSESDEIKAKEFLINKGYPIDANGTFPTYEEMYNIIREGLEKQVEQKPKWSDEDEERLQSCIIALQGKGLMGGVDTMDSKWLKSLKQRLEQR